MPWLWLFALLVFSTPAAADFYRAFNLTGGHEGGHVIHPDDRGGETYFGIARNRHPGWDGWRYVDAEMERSGILSASFNRSMMPVVWEFYEERFWTPIRGDEIPDDDIAVQLYDIAVNQGTSSAGCYLQRALNALNRAGRDFDDLVVDCKIGKRTISAARTFLERRASTKLRIGDEERQVGGKWILMGAIAFQKWRRWADIVTSDESQESFTNGWTVRGLQEIADVLHNAGAIR